MRSPRLVEDIATMRIVFVIILLILLCGGGRQQNVLAQFTSCQSEEAIEDGGALCDESGFEVLADLQAQLLLSCPLSLFPLGMDGCCRSLLQYDWWLVQSCLCSGKTGLAGLIVSQKNIVESCGCVATDRPSSIPSKSSPTVERNVAVVSISSSGTASDAVAILPGSPNESQREIELV